MDDEHGGATGGGGDDDGEGGHVSAAVPETPPLTVEESLTKLSTRTLPTATDGGKEEPFAPDCLSVTLLPFEMEKKS